MEMSAIKMNDCIDFNHTGMSLGAVLLFLFIKRYVVARKNIAKEYRSIWR